jgi:HTH-type transcriptional regulator/antitoxin HigA
MIDRLAGFDLNADQEDYLDALSTFVEVYERDRFPMGESDITPLQALKYLVEESGMSASDLGRLLGNRTLGAAILGGRRSLSKTHIKKLAGYFKVDPGLFL